MYDAVMALGIGACKIRSDSLRVQSYSSLHERRFQGLKKRVLFNKNDGMRHVRPQISAYNLIAEADEAGEYVPILG
jgi:hypothetical protein